MSQNQIVKEYPLKEPIEIVNKDGDTVETITVLKLRKPKGKILKQMDKVQGEVAKALALIAAMAGVPPSTMDELGPEDFNELAGFIDGFFPGLRRTGQTSSET